ncbi:unnamed protein product [Durusdinium trenchii]|uniref:Uncharacterized protein n=1 Tax=Durusdinium trenchii TaxID=1381693 RepID=A0ABP0LN25_9DINO
MVRIVGDGDWCHDSLGCFPALPVLEVKKVKVGGKAWQMATTGLRTHSEKQKHLANSEFRSGCAHEEERRRLVRQFGVRKITEFSSAWLLDVREKNSPAAGVLAKFGKHLAHSDLRSISYLFMQRWARFILF